MILETSQIPEPIYYCLRRPTPSRRPPRARPGQRPCPTDPFSPSMAMNVQCPSPKEAGERAAFSSAPPALVSTAPAWGAPLVFLLSAFLRLHRPCPSRRGVQCPLICRSGAVGSLRQHSHGSVRLLLVRRSFPRRLGGRCVFRATALCSSLSSPSSLSALSLSSLLALSGLLWPLPPPWRPPFTPPPVDIWVLTPPCNSYSRRNHFRSDEDHVRAESDLDAMLTYARVHSPKAIVVENVDEPEARTGITAALLSVSGYSWVTFRSCASDYGPMARDRRFWVGRLRASPAT